MARAHRGPLLATVCAESPGGHLLLFSSPGGRLLLFSWRWLAGLRLPARAA